MIKLCEKFYEYGREGDYLFDDPEAMEILKGKKITGFLRDKSLSQICNVVN